MFFTFFSHKFEFFPSKIVPQFCSSKNSSPILSLQNFHFLRGYTFVRRENHSPIFAVKNSNFWHEKKWKILSFRSMNMAWSNSASLLRKRVYVCGIWELCPNFGRKKSQNFGGKKKWKFKSFWSMNIACSLQCLIIMTNIIILVLEYCLWSAVPNFF